MTIATLIVSGSLALLLGAGKPPAAQSGMPQPVLDVAAHTRSYIGVMVQEIDADRAKELKLPEDAGVEITRVEPGSPADKAGLHTGDAILHYNGERVEGMKQFGRLVFETPPGREVKLDVYRAGAPQTVTVTVGARPPAPDPGRLSSAVTPFGMGTSNIPGTVLVWHSQPLGIECEPIEDQLAQYFGVQAGVLVRSVSGGSAAEKAGIRAGDVITRVDDGKVAAPADLSIRIRALRGKSVALVVIRDRKEITLAVTLDSDRRTP